MSKSHLNWQLESRARKESETTSSPLKLSGNLFFPQEPGKLFHVLVNAGLLTQLPGPAKHRKVSRNFDLELAACFR